MAAYSSSYNPQRPIYSDGHSHSYLSVGPGTNQIPAITPHQFNSNSHPHPLPHPSSAPGSGLILGPGQSQGPSPSPNRNSHPNPNPNPNPNHNSNPAPLPVPISNSSAAQAPALYRHTQQQQQQHQQQPQQQQFYPNAYPHPTASSSPSFIQPQVTEGQAPHSHSHAQQHVPNQIHNQHYGNGGPTSMPPPPTLPDASYARRTYENVQHQRPVEQWASGTNEEQHQIQDQYIPGQPMYYSKKQQQHQVQHPMSTGTTTASISSASPLQNQISQPLTPPSSTEPQLSMTTTIPPPDPPSQTSKSTPQPPAASPLESQRVNALLDLNRVLLQEVVTLQNAGKAGIPAQPQEPEADSRPEGESTVTPAPKAQSGRVVASKEYIEYMRRLQSNLAYLAGIAERATKPQNVLQFPAIMEEPTAGETEDGKEKLRELYGRLRELWPDWKGKQTSVV